MTTRHGILDCSFYWRAQGLGSVRLLRCRLAINVERNLVKGEIRLPKNGLTRQVDMSSQLARVLGQMVLDRKEQLLRLGLSVDDLPQLWLFQNEAGKPLDDSKIRKLFSQLLLRQV